MHLSSNSDWWRYPDIDSVIPENKEKLEDIGINLDLTKIFLDAAKKMKLVRNSCRLEFSGNVNAIKINYPGLKHLVVDHIGILMPERPWD